MPYSFNVFFVTFYFWIFYYDVSIFLLYRYALDYFLKMNHYLQAKDFCQLPRQIFLV